jgi:hypothetical protein
MANPTTNYSFAMPTNSDLVKDLPADFEVFGQAVDTQMKTNADAATQKATLTTKGDIYAATGASTPARLGVGTDGQLLVADSTAATGIKWATAGSSIPANATATVATAQSTSAGSYVDLATAGPAVTLTTGTKALVIITSRMEDLGGSNQISYMSYAVSGATTIAATDAVGLALNNSAQNQKSRMSAASVATLTAGSNTFTAKYKAQNNSQFSDRSIFVMNLA